MSAATITSNDTKASKDGLVGPDQILESEEYVTTKADGAVKIRFTEDEYGKMSADSVPGTLMKAAEEVPDIVALSVKRENKWVNWTYKEYLEGIYTLCIYIRRVFYNFKVKIHSSKKIFITSLKYLFYVFVLFQRYESSPKHLFNLD